MSDLTPMKPTKPRLLALREREAEARQVLGECQRQREAMAAYLLTAGRPVLEIVDITGVNHNRVAAVRKAIGAVVDRPDKRAKVLKVAAEIGGENVAAVAREAGVGLSYAYKVLRESPIDAIEQARMNGAKVRARLGKVA